MRATSAMALMLALTACASSPPAAGDSPIASAPPSAVTAPPAVAEAPEAVPTPPRRRDPLDRQARCGSPPKCPPGQGLVPGCPGGRAPTPDECPPPSSCAPINIPRGACPKMP